MKKLNIELATLDKEPFVALDNAQLGIWLKACAMLAKQVTTEQSGGLVKACKSNAFLMRNGLTLSDIENNPCLEWQGNNLKIIGWDCQAEAKYIGMANRGINRVKSWQKNKSETVDFANDDIIPEKTQQKTEQSQPVPQDKFAAAYSRPEAQEVPAQFDIIEQLKMYFANIGKYNQSQWAVLVKDYGIEKIILALKKTTTVDERWPNNIKDSLIAMQKADAIKEKVRKETEIKPQIKISDTERKLVSLKFQLRKAQKENNFDLVSQLENQIKQLEA